jgi:hypothetical protein
VGIDGLGPARVQPGTPADDPDLDGGDVVVVEKPGVTPDEPQSWAQEGDAARAGRRPPPPASTKPNAPAPPAPAPPPSEKPLGPGLDFDAATDTAIVKAPQTLKELAAAAFGIKPEQVGPTHLALLTDSNPSLKGLAADAKVDAGTVVSLAAAPPAVERERKSIVTQLETIDRVLSESRSAPEGSDRRLSPEQTLQLGMMRTDLVARGNALGSALPQLRVLDALGRAEAAAATAKNAAGVSAAFEGARTTAAKVPDTAAGKSARTQVALAEAQALERAGIDQLGSGDAAGGAQSLAAAKVRLDEALAQPGLSPQDRAPLLQQRAEAGLVAAQARIRSPTLAALREKLEQRRPGDTSPLPPDAAAELAQGEQDVSAAYAQARADLGDAAKAYRDQGQPDAAAKLDGASKELASREQMALGQLRGAAGDSNGQLAATEKELATVLGTPGAQPLHATERKNIGSSGDEVGPLNFFSWLGATKVGFLSDKQVADFQAKLDALPPDQKQHALEAVARYGEVGARSQNIDAVSVSHQLLAAAAKRDPNGPWAAQSEVAEGSFLLQAGNPQAAQQPFAHAEQIAGQIQDPLQAKALAARAVMGQAAALSRVAQSGSYYEKYQAANDLRTLRQRLEAKGEPLDRAGLASITLEEMRAYLGPNRAAEADEALAHLKSTYGDVPWVAGAIKQFEGQYRHSGAAAFLQVLGNEAASATPMEMLNAVALGATAGACAGVWFFGVGAIPGAIAGAAAGGLSLVTTHALRGAGNAWDAGMHGLNRQTGWDSLNDGVNIATTVAAAYAPVRAAGLVGPAALSAAAGSTDAEAQAALQSAMLRLERNMGTEKFMDLSRPAAEEAARKLILREYTNAALQVGATTTTANLGVAAASLGKQWVDIERSDMTPAEKADARRKLLAAAGQALAASLPQMAMIVVLQRAAVSGLPSELRDAVRKTASARAGISVLDDAEYRSQLKAAAENEIKVGGLAGEDAQRVRAHYDAIAARGTAYFDPAGNAYVSRSAVDSGKAGEILRHELAHQDFNGLPLSERQRLLDAYQADPQREAIRAKVLAENPHGAGFTPLQIIDEYQAIVRAEAGAAGNLKGVSATFDRALQAAGLKGVKDVNLDRLRTAGRVELPRTVRPQGGQRLAMGESGVEDLKWGKGDWGWEDINEARAFEELDYLTRGAVKRMTDAFDEDGIRAINEAYNQVAAGKATGTLALNKSGPDLLATIAEKYRLLRNAEGVPNGKPFKMTGAQVRAALGLGGGEASKVDVAGWFGKLDSEREKPVADLRVALEAQLKGGQLTPEHLVGLQPVLERLDRADIPEKLRAMVIEQIRKEILAPGKTPEATQAALAQMPARISSVVTTLQEASKGGIGWSAIEPAVRKNLAGGQVDPIRFRGAVELTKDIPGMNQRLTALMDAGATAQQLDELSKLAAVAKRLGLATDDAITRLEPGKPKLLDQLLGEKGYSIETRDKLLAAGLDNLEALSRNATATRLLQDAKLRGPVVDLIAKQAKVAADAKVPMDVPSLADRLDFGERAIAAGADRDSVYGFLGSPNYRKLVSKEFGNAIFKALGNAGPDRAADALRELLAKFSGGGPLPPELNLRDLAAKFLAARPDISWLAKTVDEAGQRYRQLPTAPRTP